ncbi:hypothetical protein [Bacillus piscicola]|uniref:hypothetical protein n=1 Tax=Bacillus piscicola TaxID=1632684 RepID=UPI001F093299|nr:hypothetical protein [Bacillus piscicola]
MYASTGKTKEYLMDGLEMMLDRDVNLARFYKKHMKNLADNLNLDITETEIAAEKTIRAKATRGK